MRNSIFEMSVIPKTLNINILRTTSAKSSNMHAIRKLIEYSLKNDLVKAILTLNIFEILLSEGRSVLSPAQQGALNERVKINLQQ